MRQRDMRQWLRGAAVLGSLVLTLLATGAAASSLAPTAAPTTSPASTDMGTISTDQLVFTVEGAQMVSIAAAVDCAALEQDIFVFYNDYLYPDVAIFLEFQTCQVDVDTTTGKTTVIIIFDVQAPSGTQPATMAEIDGAYAAYVQANPTGQLAELGPPEISRVTRDGPQAPPTASPTKAPTTADEALLPPEIGCCPNLRRWIGECSSTTDSPSACWSAKGSGGVPGVCGATKGGWFATECVFGTTWDNAAAMCASVNAALCSAAELPNALTDTGCDFSHTPVWTRDRWNLQTGECRDLEQVALDSTTGEYKCSHRSNLKAVACCAPETCPTQAPTTSPTVSPTAAPTKLTRCCEEIVEDVSIVGASGNWSDPSTNDVGVCTSRAGGWTPGVCAKTTYGNAELLCESVGAELCTPSEFALGAALPPEMGGCDPHDAYWLRGDPFRETCRPGEQQVALGDGTNATTCSMATSIKGVQCCAYSCTPPPALVPTATPSRMPTTSPTASPTDGPAGDGPAITDPIIG